MDMDSQQMTLGRIFEARRRIAPYIRRTPLVQSDWLTARAGAPVWLKLESQQVTHSFKARGAFNAAVTWRDQHGNHTRLIAASSGNHGRALSYAAKLLGFPCTIYAASTTAETKLDAIRANGAELVTSAADFDEAEAAAKERAASSTSSSATSVRSSAVRSLESSSTSSDSATAIYVSPYNDEHVVAATGTIGVELIEDQPSIDTILVPLGGGGLISGVAAAAKAMRPSVRIIGVEAAANPAFHTARKQGGHTLIDALPTLADGVSGNVDRDSITLSLVAHLVDDIVLIDEAEIARAVRDLAVQERLIVEGAGALAVAAIATGRVAARSAANGSGGATMAAVISGANIGRERLAAILGANE